MKHVSMTSLTNSATSMPTISPANPLAVQSPNTQEQFVYIPECPSDLSSWMHTVLESDSSLGLLDNYPSLPAPPRPVSGLGIFCLDSTSPFVPDGISVVGYPINDMPTTVVDHPFFDSKDTMHHPFPPYNLFDDTGHRNDFSLANWSFDLALSGEGGSITSLSDSSIASISSSTSSSSLQGNQRMPFTSIVPDINMFELAWSQQVLSGAVDPADTLIVSDRDDGTGGDPDSPMPLSSACSSPVTLKSPLNAFPTSFIDEILSFVSAESKDQAGPAQDEVFVKADTDALTYAKSAPEPLDPPLLALPLDTLRQDIIQVPVAQSPPLIPTQPSSPPKFRVSAVHITNIPATSRRQVKSHEKADLPDMGTPVLDAHHGIYLEELRAKADRYRQRNPGEDIDKRWLNSFAGKLSERGELLDDFRCYVNGCYQTNKRRDHILIHVGSHVDQRPFVCGHCTMRFLRKNECKRHEASHTGHKPYVCDICPAGEKAFVRLDLLKRHLKRAHAVDSSANKENLHKSSKRAKLCY